MLEAPGLVQVTLPPYEQLLLWNFDPEEEGTGDYPPRVDDATVTARLVTWIRLRYPPLPRLHRCHDHYHNQPPPRPRARVRPPLKGKCAGGCGCLGGVSTAPTSAVLAADAASGQPAGRLTWVGVNAASAVQAVPVSQEIVGTGTGTPFQTCTVANTPVVMDATGFLLEVQGPGGWTTWQQIDDIYAAAPDDRSTCSTRPPGSSPSAAGSSARASRSANR